MMGRTMLYSFVVVDDEPEIREGIRDTIPWEDLGFRFAGACSNGNEALELVERDAPDVLMTDINMPFMDGLALSERLSTLAPATKVLIISGYDDFEYARRALKLQVYDYIVKPITPSEFKAVLKKLREQLDQERMAQYDIEKIKQQLTESLPILRERFLNQLITGKFKGNSVAERIDYFNLPLPITGTFYQCLIMDFIHRKSGEQFDLDLISVWDLLDKIVGQNDSAILLRDEEDRLVLVVWGSNPEALYRESLKMGEGIRRNLSSSGMDTIAVALGETVPELDSLAQSYQRALRALKVAELRGKAGVITYRELAGPPREERESIPNYGKTIAGALKTSNLEDAYAAIDTMIGAFQSSLFEIGTYHRTLQLILASILQSLEDLEIPQSELFPPEEDPFDELRNLKTLDEVRSWFANLAESIVACTGARQENFAQAKVREALEYLETHYADPELSLQSLCKELYISTSYFSAVLKKYHDKTFVEQLTEIRMRRAMELLRTTGLKTYDISEQVGLRDPHYFSLCFRKYTGVTSTEFRNGKDHG